MKIVWEPNDIFAGRRVGKPNRKERWMIGYDPREESCNHWTLNSLEDGMISERHCTRRGIADRLNRSEEFPEELIQILERSTRGSE